MSKLKVFADDKNEILLSHSRKHCSNRRNCWLQVFSPCPNMFSKRHRFQDQEKSRLFGTGTQDIYSNDSIIQYNVGYIKIK